MLIQFRFKNYKSFCYETELDLSAKKMTDSPEHVITEGRESILPVASIYGPDKSDIYSAFEYMNQYVLHSSKDENDIKDFDSFSQYTHTCFEIYFTLPYDQTQKCYYYGFCIHQKGIIEEWLKYKENSGSRYSVIFYRGYDILDLKGIPKTSRENIKKCLKKNELIVSLGAKLEIEECCLVYNWFLNNQFVRHEASLCNENITHQKIFSLYPNIKEVLRNGGVFFIDGCIYNRFLEDSLILMFLDPKMNVNHAQLILTTQTSWLSLSRLLRMDEMWFTGKKENIGVSVLYSLADFIDERGTKIEVHKDKKYKIAMLEKYGVLPSLHKYII